jgi:hypothetical protein
MLYRSKRDVYQRMTDTGYYSDDNMQSVRSQNLTPYIATQRLKHYEAAYGPNAADEDRAWHLQQTKTTSRTSPVFR